MKQFFQTVKKSVYGPEWYSIVIEQSFWQAFWYFLKLILFTVFLGFVFFGIITLFSWKEIRSEANAFHRDLINLFPDELVLTFENGELHTNMSDPFPIALPDHWKSAFVNERGEIEAPQNLVVFDASKTIERADFEKQDTMFIVGKKEIGFYDVNQDKTEIRGFGSQGGTRVVDKSVYSVAINEAWHWLKVLSPVIVLLILLFSFVGLVIGNLLYLVFGALAVWLGAVIAKKQLVYVQAYKASMYLLTLPILVMTLCPEIPFFRTLLLVVLAYFNFRSFRGAEPQSTETESPSEKKPLILPEAVLVEKAE